MVYLELLGTLTLECNLTVHLIAVSRHYYLLVNFVCCPIYVGSCFIA
jgi:hypothetical protein